jgi:hypothetical protein
MDSRAYLIIPLPTLPHQTKIVVSSVAADSQAKAEGHGCRLFLLKDALRNYILIERILQGLLPME